MDSGSSDAEVMVNDSDGSSAKIKVVDRRWFTEDGALRADRPAGPGTQEAPEPAAAVASEPPPRPQAPASRDSAATTSRAFVELIVMLAQQAELMISGTEGLDPHPDEARRLIDALGALELKTRGNLSTEESRILSDVLYQLRTLFVQGRS